MCLTQRYLMYISYLGTDFRGSQIQNNVLKHNSFETVQGNLETALNKIFKHLKKNIRITLSSRTDLGVHAIKAGVHFDLPAFNGSFLFPEIIQKKLNHYLSKNEKIVRILDVIPVSDKFHARFSALEKVYIYRIGILKEICLNKNIIRQPPISEIKHTLFLSDPYINLEKVKNATKLFQGEKDFGAFAVNYSKYNKNTICKINFFNLKPCKPFMPDLDALSQNYNFYHFICSGNRFLHKMIRRMVSSVLAVGYNKLTLSDIQLMLDHPVPPFTNKIITSPGFALYLSDVIFNLEHIAITEEEKKTKMKMLKVIENEHKLNMEILLQKKKSLKPVETIVTNVLGQKTIEKKDKYGVLSTTKLLHKCSGFVIDNNPDLQVCQILNYLFLGSQDPLQDNYLLRKFGITHVLTIGVTLPNSFNLPNIVHKKIELLDVPEASLMNALKISLDFIDTVHKENLNNKIFVHCNAGYSRSPAIVIGYLMKKYKYSLKEAYKFVNEKRRVRPNDGFIKQLETFEKALQ